jgi:putative ABC transport system permease protein
MLFNYFLLSFRNLRKQRGYAIVNMLGLAVGIGSALMILLYVLDELTYDNYHPHAEHTYRIGYKIQFPNGQFENAPYAPSGWDNYIKNNYPGIGPITSFTTAGMPTSIGYEPKDKIVLTEEIIWAEPNFHEVIHIPVINGSPTQPLKEVNGMMLSRSAARELFGDEDPINKMVTVQHTFMTNGQKINMMVSAVYDDLPGNTHIKPKYIFNILSLKPVFDNLEHLLNSSMGDEENNFFTQSFFVCDDESKLPAIREDLQKRANAIIARFNLDFKFTPFLRKITDVHFDKDVNWGQDERPADMTYLYVFISIATLILLVACINYVNLSTAKSANRAREIGLRKTFGGIRLQLFTQFMMESFVLVLISAVVALLLVLIFIPAFNDLTAKTFSYKYLFTPTMITVAGGVVIFVTLFAGAYPALFVSGFQPANVLKGKFAFRKGSQLFRQFLTTIQFIVAVTLLSGTVIVVRQMNLMRNSKLNEAGRQIVSIRYGGFTGVADNQKYLTFKNEVLKDPELTEVTLANHLPRLEYFGPIGTEMQFPEINEEKYQWFQLNGDYDFPKTFDMKIIAGRDFDPENTRDSSAILLNESAVKALKLTPAEVIGKAVIRPAFIQGYERPDSTRAPVTGTVIGVVEDFPYRSMHSKIDPLAISPVPHRYDRIIHVRLPEGKMGEKIAYLERVWKQTFPDFGFDYWFIDEEFARMYAAETKVAELTEKFSGLAILITCVGLYGLASFLGEQRTKEIGVRKTLGASNSQIFMMLLKVFGKLLLIASIIGIPVAFYFASQWLDTFVYKTPLSVFVFVGSLVLISTITIVTVGYEALKASMANPVKALKHE